MIIKSVDLQNAHQTGRLMYAMVNKWYMDMAPWADLTMFEVFDVIKALPFQPDPKGVELIKRPYYTMNKIGPGGDCDDKAIAAGAWAKLNGYPYRFIGVGRYNSEIKTPFWMKLMGQRKILLSHVYLEVYILGKWILFDPTYSFNVLGQNLGNYDRMEVLKP